MNKFVAMLTTLTLIGINRQDVHQPLTDTKLIFEKHDAISQTFHSKADRLNIVSICMRNPERRLLPLEFSLHESTTSAAPVRTLSFDGGNIDNQDCTRLQFEPVPDSAGKEYVARIRATQPEVDFPHSAIYFESYRGNDYVKGEAYLDEAKTGSDLHFKTFYRADLGTTVSQSASQFFRRLGSDLPFVIPYLLLLGYLIFRLIRARK